MVRTTIALLLMAAAAQAQHISGPGREITKTVIADGIYQFTVIRDSYVRQLNSIAIVNADDVLIFDTCTRPSTARLILAEVRKITDKPVRYVVNSHWHPDHWSGNEVYADAFPGVTIIASTRTKSFMKKRVRRVFPTLTYEETLTLQHGGREFRFMSITGDAEGTTALYLPKERVLMTGDAVSFPLPYVTPPPTRHLASLRMLERLDAAVIIPGHGPAFHDRSFIDLEISLLETVTAGVRRALREGMLTLDEVANAVPANELRAAFTHGDPDLEQRYPARVRDIVRIAIREARDGQDYQ